jgi:hypothetical protein
MRIRTALKAGITLAIGCAALLAGTVPASALSGEGFIPNSAADGQFVAHGSAVVYNVDQNAEHWVNGELGVFAPVSGKTTHLTISGSGVGGEVRTCILYVMPLPNGLPQQTFYHTGPVSGLFTVGFDISLTFQSHLSVSCNLGKATATRMSVLYDVYITQSP